MTADAPPRQHGNHWLILAALVLGVVAGFGFQLSADAAGVRPGWVEAVLEVCRFGATLFLNALKMVIVPLVTASIISGIAGLSSLEGFGRMGLKTVGYYAVSSVVAITVGLGMVNLLEPGLEDGVPNPTLVRALEGSTGTDNAEDVSAIMDKAEGGAGAMVAIFQRMIPTNIIAAAAAGDLLALIFVSILFGCAMIMLPGGPPAVLRDVFVQLAEVMTLITVWIMKFTPLAVFCLITPAMTEAGIGILQNLGPYVVTVVGALLLHLLVVMPLVLRFVAGVSPWQHFRNMRDALLMSFSTASSSATIPVTLRCLRENGKVPDRVSSFTIPLGATVNMDGTALYECVVVMFAAQILGLELSFAQQFTVVFLALVTSIGVAGIPAASLVAIIIIMQNVGMTEEMITASLALVLAIDRPLDMARTMVNVFSDSVAAVVIARSENALPGPEAGEGTASGV